MKTRVLHTKIWEDDYFSSLTTQQKIIFLYYLTNDRVNIIHCYEIKDQRVTSDTGVSRGVLENFKTKLQEDDKIRFYKNYVFLVNAWKYESYRGVSNDTAKEVLLKEMSLDVLDWYNNKTDRGVHRGVATPPINKKQEIINNKGVVKGEIKEEDLQAISDKYNVPLSIVKLSKEKMDNWLEAKGKTYKNYSAGLRNWVLREAKEAVEIGIKPKSSEVILEAFAER